MCSNKRDPIIYVLHLKHPGTNITMIESTETDFRPLPEQIPLYQMYEMVMEVARKLSGGEVPPCIDALR